MSQLMLSFFEKVGFSEVDDNSKFKEINQQIQSMQQKWLSYDIKLT